MSIYDEILHDIEMLYEKTSKKEQHRIDNFKKRHKYDEESGTIETDIVDKKTGKKQRINFEITNEPENSEATAVPADEKDRGDISNYKIFMPRKTLKQKPMISTSALKHEEGHVSIMMNPSLYDDIKKEIKHIIDNRPKKFVLNIHGQNPDEYLADIYASNTSQYGLAGVKKMCNAMKEIAISLNTLVDEIYRIHIETFAQRPTETELDRLLKKELEYKKLLAELDKRLKYVTEIYDKTTDPAVRKQCIDAINTIREYTRDTRTKIDELRKPIQRAKKEFKSALKNGKYKKYVLDDSINAQKNETELRKDVASRYTSDKRGVK